MTAKVDPGPTRFPTPNPDLAALFGDVLSAMPEAEARSMFGCPCAFINGNMFAGLYGDSIMVRLGDDGRSELMRVKGAAQFEPVPGRVWREYVVVPATLLEAPDELAGWLRRSLEYTRSLPPKPSRARAVRRAKHAA